MELVISALERQLKIEEAKLEKRERMIATSNQVVHSEPLPNANKEYIEQLKKAIYLINWESEALECLNECQQYHMGGHSIIGQKIRAVIKKSEIIN